MIQLRISDCGLRIGEGEQGEGPEPKAVPGFRLQTRVKG